MRVGASLSPVVLVVFATSLAAQYPDQFYTNGEKMDVWRREDGRRTIMWFSKEPGERIRYQQSLVVLNDDEPDYAYYIDLGTRKYVGRYSFSKDKYSVLPTDERRTDRADIPEAAFPPLGALPTVDELLDSENTNGLLDPPPTKEFPKLRTGTWVSVYFTRDRKPIRASVVFQGEGGSYSFRIGGEDFEGTLDSIEYTTTEAGTFVIRGAWSLHGSTGYFIFRILPDNLNTFTGEWGTDRIEGTWTGVRAHGE